MDAIIPFLVLLSAYLLGSIPSALIVSQRAVGVDIRKLGDGNMGARNISRTIGWKAGLMVALIDISKGMAAVLIAKATGLNLFWQIIAATCVVLGHDFPLFASFRGGQGFATCIGVLTALAPIESVLGLSLYGAIYWTIRNSDLGASLGIGTLIMLEWMMGEPRQLVFWSILIILSVPAKKAFDRPRRLALQQTPEETEINKIPGSSA